MDARQQLARRESLRDVVVGPSLKPRHLVALLGASSEEDDGQLARLAISLERPRKLKPAHVGQHPVDENKVGASIGERGAGTATVFGLTHVKTRAFQAKGDHLPDRPLILNDQNLL